MRRLVLGISAAALIAAAVFVAAQAQDQSSAAAPSLAAPTAAPVAPTAPAVPHARQGVRMHLAAINTSDAAFRKLDTDNDGRISALEAANNVNVATAFTMADKDRDGYLSREEFKSVNAASTQSSDVDVASPSGDTATEPSGDHASDPSGDQPATPPSDSSD